CGVGSGASCPASDVDRREDRQGAPADAAQRDWDQWGLVVGDGIFQIPSDLVVKSQAIDIAEVILSRIRRPHVVHTLCRHRKSRCELPSTSEAHWFTTKSECAVKAQWRNVARPERMQVRSEPLELSAADHSAG